MKTLLIGSALALVGASMTTTIQAPPRTLAIQQIQAPNGALTVRSRSFTDNGTIPTTHADYGEKVSPNVSWTGAPNGSKSVVLLMEDPDAREPKPFVHWILYNLPSSVTALPESVPGRPRLPEFGGALQGRNSHGTTGYFGPRPPKGDPPHHYHFQVFSLDTMLTLDPGADAAAILAAMKGHVQSSGELVGTYQAP